MGMVGMKNNMEIEGRKKNIKCNVIVKKEE
jgi:hypothetical protein